MKKTIYMTFALLAVILVAGGANAQKVYPVVFYNLENLFDTIPSAGNNDREFTPDGQRSWNSDKYWKKISNVERVFSDMAKSLKTFPTVIGVSEIENRNVLEDIVATPKLRVANYAIVHYDSPDARGVDVGLVYRPDQFKIVGSYAYEVRLSDSAGSGSAVDRTGGAGASGGLGEAGGEEDAEGGASLDVEEDELLAEDMESYRATRDILAVWGTIKGERFCFFVCHWPSRLGGSAASEHRRVAAAQVVKHVADSMMSARPDTKIVIMGDMNDDPNNASMYEVLGAGGGKTDKVAQTEFYNPFYDMFRAGIGTLAYGDSWNLFDNMIVNGNLLNAHTGQLKLWKNRKKKYYGNIFKMSYMTQREGRYKGYPLRTFQGADFQNGFSDHFPVFLLISK